MDCGRYKFRGARGLSKTCERVLQACPETARAHEMPIFRGRIMMACRKSCGERICRSIHAVWHAPPFMVTRITSPQGDFQ